MDVPDRRFDPFPADGEWAKSEWFTEVAPEHASALAISEAVAALRPIFSPERVRELPGNGRMPHPFAWHYFQRGGIRLLLRLGRCLSLIGSPPEIVSDLIHPTRFETRSAEAWAGALFVRLGAKIRFVPEREEGMKPEFIATFPEGHRLAVEVKGLSTSEKENWLHRVTLAFMQGIWDTQMTRDPRQHSPSRADITPPIERLQEIAQLKSEPLEEARALGRAVGEQWAEFLEHRPPVGRHAVSPSLRVDILPDGEWSGSGQFMMRSPPPPKLHAFQRLQRGPLRGASLKFQQHELPGVLVIEKPEMGRWDSRDLDKLASELKRPATWAEHVAAVLVKFDHDHHDLAYLMPGPLAEQLPARLTERFPNCSRCGLRHAEVNFLD